MAISVLDEDCLRHISRSIRDYVPASAATEQSSPHDEIKQFEALLNHVFTTSNSSTLSASHRVAAWNTLCSLIDRSLDSGLPEVRNSCWSLGIWNRSLGLYLNHARHARPKSSRQLLATLTTALGKGLSKSNLDVVVLSGYAIRDLLGSLQDYEDPPRAKASAQLLANLLQKDVIPISSVLGYVPVQSENQRASIQELLYTIFRWLGKGEFGSTIATTVSAILDKVDTAEDLDIHAGCNDSGPIWLDTLQKVYEEDPVHMDDLRAHILPVLFKRKFGDFVAFLKYQGLTGFSSLTEGFETKLASKAIQNDELLYAALQTGKDLSLLLETENKQIACTPSLIYLPIAYIESLLCQSSRPARLAGLWLLVTSPSATRPLSQRALQLIKNALAIFFADVDADFRSEVFGAVQRLTDRIRSVTKVLSQKTAKDSGVDESSQTLKHHKDFLQSLGRFLVQEMRPSASYQRHISALKCASILARSGLDEAVSAEFWTKSARGETRWPFHLDILTKGLQRQLLDLLLDPFDDVRQAAASLLHLYCSSANAAASGEIYRHALRRAENKMYLTGRADQADGVAYLYSLLHKSSADDCSGLATGQGVLSDLIQKLEDLLAIAVKDLSTAVERYPLHGLVTSLRYVLSDTKDLDDASWSRIYDSLVRVWELVKPILCDDAPEGYLPEELEETSNSTKETLSYCWRALKESSLLLSSMIVKQHAQSKQSEALSELCFIQLSELRHRGAFSTVAQTWNACCIRCQDLLAGDQSALQNWYVRTIEMLHRNVTINTRRSAGLPSLVCGILIADKSDKLLQSAFTDLEAVSRKRVDAASAEEGSLPQVHAMNCMKDILKNASLGERSERYVPVALQLAADALQSDVWAIRNCGLMLFRAVIDRLLGTSAAHFEDDSHVQKRISIDQHPELLDVILRLLVAPAQDVGARYEGVFPALQLLQLTRLPRERLAEVKLAVRRLTAAQSWHVRDKAARTLSALEDTLSVIHSLQEELAGEQMNENRLHGLLLFTGYTLARARNDLAQGKKSTDICQSRSLEQDLSSIGLAAAEMFRLSRSPVTKAAVLDVFRECSALGQNVSSKYDHGSLLAYLAAAQGVEDSGIHTLFEQILKAHLNDASTATVRQAWARLLAQYLSIGQPMDKDEVYGYHKLIQELSHHDQDACRYLLEALRSKLDGSQPMTDIVVDACLDSVNSLLGIELRCEAQNTLLVLCSQNKSNVDLAVALSSRDALQENSSNQKYIDQSLQLYAIQLEHRTTTDMDEKLLQDVVEGAQECASAVDGTGIHTREAGAEALDCIRSLWLILSKSSDTPLDSAFLRLCVAVYDLLNDDDEDTRLQAARITSHILATGSVPGSSQPLEFEPIIASQKLLGFCIRRWKSNSDFVALVLGRAFGLGKTLPSPVIEQLDAAAQNDNALFAEEKQNLYIDEAREARAWSQAVHRLDVHAIPKEAVAQLAIWIADALDALTEHAKQHHDGALGWSTNGDVYALGLRVFYGTEVLFDLAGRGVRVPLKPSELRMKLFVCLTAFEDGGADGLGQVNCLWRWEAERVLKDSVANKVKSLGSSVEQTTEKAIGMSLP